MRSMLEDERDSHTFRGLSNKYGHEGCHSGKSQESHYWGLRNVMKVKSYLNFHVHSYEAKNLNHQQQWHTLIKSCLYQPIILGKWLSFSDPQYLACKMEQSTYLIGLLLGFKCIIHIRQLELCLQSSKKRVNARSHYM